MSILGIDYGKRKVGLAVSDRESRLALPLTIILWDNNEQLISDLKTVCAENDVEKIIIGVPLTLGVQGEDIFFRQKDLQNKQMHDALSFVELIKAHIQLPIVIEDERLSTKMANALNKGLVKDKGKDDAVAAMVILQNYLDKQR